MPNLSAEREAQFQSDHGTFPLSLYEEHRRRENLSGIKTAFLEALILNPLFIALDIFAIADHFWIIQALRILTTMILAVAYAIVARATRWIVRHSDGAYAFVNGVVALFIDACCWLDDGYESPYCLGLLFIVFGTPTLVTWPMRLAVAFNVTLYILYMLPWLLGILHFKVMLVALTYQFFLVGMIIQALMGQRHRYRREANEFYGELVLRETQDSLALANNQLKSLDELKDQFFANISHELRTPLTLSVGPLETVLRTFVGIPDEAKSYLQVVQRNQRRLLRLINDLLDFAKLSSGNAEFHYRPDDVVHVVRYLASTLEAATKDRDISLAVEAEFEACELYVDHDAFEKVVMNLLSNAFKFTPDGGRIEVRLRAAGEGEIALEVADTGVGIPKEKQATIFERFRQVDSSTTRKYAGTGIGLSMVKEYVELHGGRVEVESEPGAGSTFRVFLKRGFAHLPEAQVEQVGLARATHAVSGELDHVRLSEFEVDDDTRDLKPDALAGAAGASPPNSGDTAFSEPGYAALTGVSPSRLSLANASVPPSSVLPGDDDLAAEAQRRLDEVKTRLLAGVTVLVVDDTTDMRRYIASLLQPYYRVVTARDGLEGLEKAREIYPDLIISDVMMPRMSGEELCQAVKAAPGRLSRTPVMLVTARADVQGKLDGLVMGADDYLFKPFNAEELQLRIRNLIRARRQERALYLAHRELAEDLELARRFQQRLLPTQVDVPSWLKLMAQFRPALQVGGDLYDVRVLPSGAVRTLLVDVNGHGVQAAFGTMVVRTTYAAFQHEVDDPGTALTELSERLMAQYGSEVGLSACLVDVHPPHAGSARIRFAHSFELTPWLVKAGEARMVSEGGGFMLGVLPGITFRTFDLELREDERLLLLTDGLREQLNVHGAAYEDSGLAEELKSAAHPLPLDDALSGVMRAYDAFRGEVEQRDDVTLIGLELG